MPFLLAVLTLVLALPSAAGAQERVTICHATGNDAAPYVQIDLDNAGVLEHVNHEDDLVPAPAGGCPSQVVPDPTVTPDPTATPAYPLPTATATATATPVPARTPRPERDRDDEDEEEEDDTSGPAPRSGVMPTVTGGMPEQTATAAQDLPMTGSEVWLIGLAGLGFLLAGAGVRLRTAG